jgi:hypothetical protein
LTPRAPQFLPPDLLMFSLIPLVTKHPAVQVPGILAPVLTLVQTWTTSRSARFPLSSVLRKGLLLPPGVQPYATRILNAIISCTHRFRLGLVPQGTRGLQASANGSTTASLRVFTVLGLRKLIRGLVPPAGLQMTMSDPSKGSPLPPSPPALRRRSHSTMRRNLFPLLPPLSPMLVTSLLE